MTSSLIFKFGNILSFLEYSSYFVHPASIITFPFKTNSSKSPTLIFISVFSILHSSLQKTATNLFKTDLYTIFSSSVKLFKFGNLYVGVKAECDSIFESSNIVFLSLNLIGNNYTFKVNKGIGKVLIDNKEVSDNEVLGMGSNTIKLNGGIGDTTVTLNKDR